VCFSNWLHLRGERVIAKGKGELVTYWLDLISDSSAGKSSCSSRSVADTNANSGTDAKSSHNPELPRIRKVITCASEKVERLIDWNADTLCRLLQRIVDSRRATTPLKTAATGVQLFRNELSTTSNDVSLLKTSKPFDEVKEIIALPQVKAYQIITDKPMDDVSSEVVHQLHDYISSIAQIYNENYFHNFEHVCLSIWLCACLVLFNTSFRNLQNTYFLMM
jgi:hypothetical protein